MGHARFCKSKPLVVGCVVAVRLMAVPCIGAEQMTVGDYRVRIDDRGRIAVYHGRLPIITKSYAGMYGPMPGGSLTQHISASMDLKVGKTGEGTDNPGLVIHNTGKNGTKMRREIAFTPEGVRLLRDLTIPSALEGSIDCGLTLNPEITIRTRVTYRTQTSGEPSAGRLGADPDSLPYETGFRKATFEGECGKVSVEFLTGEHVQEYGKLLNMARSSKYRSLSAQVLTLSQSVPKDKPCAIHKSVCVVRFEPASGKIFLSPLRNRVYNASFENWLVPDLPDGWRRSPYATKETSAGIAADDGASVHGERSLRWTLAEGTLTHIPRLPSRYTPMQIEPPCIFSVYLKGDPAGMQAALTCGRARRTVVTTGEWTRHSVVAKDESEAGNFRATIEKLSPGTLWIDGAQLEQGETATPFAASTPSCFTSPSKLPVGRLKKEIEELSNSRTLLGGCGPELSYYTTETQGRLIYEIGTAPGRHSNAALLVSLAGPDGKVLKKGEPLPAPGGRVIVHFDAASLPVGTSRASAKLVEAGKTLATTEHDVTKLPPLEPGIEVKIDRLRKVLVRGGEPYIPVGSDAKGPPADAREILRAESANGFNTVHLWAGFYDTERSPGGPVLKLRRDYLKQILDDADAAGMAVTVNLSHWFMANHSRKTRFHNKDVTEQDLLDEVLTTVRSFRGHPALLTWHLIDEPTAIDCPPAWISRAYRAVKEADPYHPAEINVCGSGTRMLSFLESSDLMSIDMYPVTRSHVGIVAPETRYMWKAGGWRPVRWGIQSYGYTREPTPDEEICMAYQAIVEGTRFLLFYNYRPTSYRVWQSLGQVASEIRALTPALLSEVIETVEVQAGRERVPVTVRRVGREVYVIAVNRDTEPVNAVFALPPDCKDKEADVLFESRRVRMAGRVLRDRFSPMARHVYRITL